MLQHPRAATAVRPEPGADPAPNILSIARLTAVLIQRHLALQSAVADLLLADMEKRRQALASAAAAERFPALFAWPFFDPRSTSRMGEILGQWVHLAWSIPWAFVQPSAPWPVPGIRALPRSVPNVAAAAAVASERRHDAQVFQFPNRRSD